ncbi:MAG: hypothetical protein P9M12_02420 [Candidatus Aceula lacicola]|nr:hypothetical protein [Candidatus Aceula lacicola]
MGTLKELQRPDSLEQYKKYILQKYKPTIGFGDEFEQKFLRNQAIVSHMIKDSVFWKELLKDLREIDVNYRMKNKNLDLIPYLEKIELNKKKPDSVVDKVCRISVLENDFPFESKEFIEELILPENVFEKINDIVRTEIIVKYADGIDIVLESIKRLAKEHDHDFFVKIKGEDEGYFAKHIYLSYETCILDFESNPKKIIFSFEIQIRTQLQDTIKSILHKYYRSDRVSRTKKSESHDWKWEFRKPRFIPNYIGHILHFFDGVIVQIKDKGDIDEYKS